MFQNQVTELQHQLQLFKEVTSFSFTLFNFFKWSQKLSNLSLFTDEKEFIWDDWQEKIRDKLKSTLIISISIKLFWSTFTSESKKMQSKLF